MHINIGDKMLIGGIMKAGRIKRVYATVTEIYPRYIILKANGYNYCVNTPVTEDDRIGEEAYDAFVRGNDWGSDIYKSFHKEAG